MPRPLPQLEEDHRDQMSRAAKQAADLSDPVPARATKFVDPKEYGYLIHISQQGQGIAAVTIMVNKKLFTQAEIDRMVGEAAKITNETCLAERRKYLAAQKVGIDQEMNERMFPTDVEFFEGVMMDKWEFKRLSTVNANTAIEPTAKIARPAA